MSMKKPLSLVLAAGLCCALAGVASAQTYNSTTTPVALPNLTTVNNSITVLDSFAIADLNVRIDITHTWDSDLDIVLIVPGGTQYVHLCTDVGGAGDNFNNTIFDQQAATAITSGAAPFAGSFRPEGGVATPVRTGVLTGLTPLTNLDSVNGTNSAGTWTLRIDDDSSGDVGTLNSWSLIFLAAGAPTNPSGIATLAPTSGTFGAVVLATVAVTPGTFPASSGITVVANAAAIDGGTVNLLDNGVAPDALAGDNIFSANLTVGPAAALGAQTVSFLVSDAQSRSSTTNASFTVRPPAASNDLCANAIVLGPTLPVLSGPALVAGNAATSEVAMCVSSGYSVWYSFTPELSGLHVIDTSTAGNGTNIADTVLAIYSGACGATTQIACNDDFGGSLRSQVSASLNAGETYLIQVARFGTTAPAVTDALGVAISFAGPVSPVIDGGFAPTTGVDNCGSGVTLLTASVTPGSNPVSTNLQVTADLTALGGSATTQLFDDGTNGDVTAGDNIFSLSYTIPTTAVVGLSQPVFTVTDGEGRSDTDTGDITILACPPANTWYEVANGGGDAGNLPSSAQVVVGTASGAPVAQIRGSLDSGSDVDMYQIDICDQSLFSASSFPGTSYDTQLFLFNNAGLGVVMNDDVPEGFPGDATLQSRIGNSLVLNGGTYYLAISRYDADPASGGVDIWLDTPFDTERAPDGPGAAGAVDAWSTTTSAAGNYVIVLEGTCYVVNPPACAWRADGCFADYNNDDGIDGDDVIAFFADWDNANICADVDDSDGVDGDDVILFFASWDLGGTGFPGC
jgi:subtilisin-like proprotein convertase family protein